MLCNTSLLLVHYFDCIFEYIFEYMFSQSGRRGRGGGGGQYYCLQKGNGQSNPQRNTSCGIGCAYFDRFHQIQPGMLTLVVTFTSSHLVLKETILELRQSNCVFHLSYYMMTTSSGPLLTTVTFSTECRKSLRGANVTWHGCMQHRKHPTLFNS